MKTVRNTMSVDEFIAQIGDERKRADCITINALCEKITGKKGRMWGSSIIGYGTYSYTRSDGKFYEFFALGFSPRKTNITIYNIPGYDQDGDLMKKLGVYKTGKSCLYLKKVSDIDLGVLETILTNGYTYVQGKHLDYKTGQWSDVSHT